MIKKTRYTLYIHTEAISQTDTLKQKKGQYMYIQFAKHN